MSSGFLYHQLQGKRFDKNKPRGLLTADSHCCTTKPSQHCKAIVLQLKVWKKSKERTVHLKMVKIILFVMCVLPQKSFFNK